MYNKLRKYYSISNYGPVLYCFWDNARYLSKIAIFYHPCIWCPC